MSNPRWPDMATFTGTGTCPVCKGIGSGLVLIHLHRCEKCLGENVMKEFHAIWKDFVDHKITRSQMLDFMEKLRESKL